MLAVFWKIFRRWDPCGFCLYDILGRFSFFGQQSDGECKLGSMQLNHIVDYFADNFAFRFLFCSTSYLWKLFAQYLGRYSDVYWAWVAGAVGEAQGLPRWPGDYNQLCPNIHIVWEPDWLYFTTKQWNVAHSEAYPRASADSWNFLKWTSGVAS